MTEPTAPKKIVKPIIISNNKKMVIKSPKLFNMKLPLKSIQQYKEEVIYAKQNCDFLKGESQDVLIVNRMNMLDKSCRTVARCTSRGACIETTSDNVVSAIGQKNYETVLSALSSVFNEETKVRGILSLLSVQKKFNTLGTQTTMEITEVKKDHVNIACQTHDSREDTFIKERQRKRIRRNPLTPYVVTENPKVKRFVVNPDDVKKDLTRKKIEEKIKDKPLPDLREALNEDSNISSVSNFSASSWPSVPGILENTNEFLGQIDKVTDKTLNSTEIKLRDGSVIMIPVKPEDDFHIATPEVLKNVTHEERMKLIWHQAFIDFKMCLVQDEDGYYPLHVAVLTNDVDLVRRQCASLRARHETIDILAAGLTALHMAVRQNAISCVNILLQNGADPLLCDAERRCSLHLAAEMESPLLSNLLAYCDNHARSILKTNQEFWKPDFESKSDFELKRIMYNCISEMFDDQGYNPLMLASEAAIPANVFLLARRAGALVDAAAPGSGSTALYRAAAAACLYTKETGNTTSVPEKYLKSIEILVEYGADPSVENHSGSSVNTLLTEFSISSVSMTIANKMTAMRHGKYAADGLNMFLYKHGDGTISYKNINDVTDGKSDIAEPKTVENGLHAVITVDVPAKSPRKSDTKEVSIGNSENSEHNLMSVKSNASTSEVVNASLIKSESKGIHILNDIQNDNVVLTNATSDNNEINADKLTEYENEITQNAIKKCIVRKKIKQIENGGLITSQVKLNSVLLQPKILLNSTLGGEDNTSNIIKCESGNALKVDLKGVKDGNLGNVTFTRLSSGQMVAITTAPVDVVTPAKNRTYSLLKVDQTPPFKSIFNEKVKIKKPARKTKTVAKKTKPQGEPTAKKRKAENVVIVENVSLKPGFPIANMNPGTSKTAKAKDIVISPKISPKSKTQDTTIKELTMEDISPKIVIGEGDVETVIMWKRKLVSE